MKHYKPVEFFSIFRMSRPPFVGLYSGVEQQPGEVLHWLQKRRWENKQRKWVFQ